MWTYGETLRQMAANNRCTGVEFARISQSADLKGIPEDFINDLDEEKYLKLAPLARRSLMETYGDPQLNVNEFIASDSSVKSTYLGYLKFLQKDLASSWQSYDSGSASSGSDGSSSSKSSTSSRKSFKRRIAGVAKQMITRGRVSLLYCSFT